MQQRRAASWWWRCSAILAMVFGFIAVLVSVLQLIGGKGPVAFELLYLLAGGFVVAAGWSKYNDRSLGLRGRNVP